jgi:pimeloyl-ACP methyl ester carboxylesterase
MVVALAGAAALLAGCGGGSSPAGAAKPAAQHAPAVRPAAVLATPTRVADTAAGAVGYREIGTGSPVLLIMGLSGSMDDWSPAFVARLAAGHEVIELDNAGVGQTASLTSPLSTAVNRGKPGMKMARSRVTPGLHGCAARDLNPEPAD